MLLHLKRWGYKVYHHQKYIILYINYLFAELERNKKITTAYSTRTKKSKFRTVSKPGMVKICNLSFSEAGGESSVAA